MKKNKYYIIAFFFLIASCKKDPLNGELEIFKGRFKWIGFHAKNCVLCGVNYYESSVASFKAEIEFDNNGKASFIIDNEVLVQKKFKIKKKEQIGTNNWEIEISIDVPKSKLDINNKLTLTIKGDTMSINKYPYPGYEASGKISLGNTFVRQ